MSNYKFDKPFTTLTDLVPETYEGEWALAWQGEWVCIHKHLVLPPLWRYRTGSFGSVREGAFYCGCNIPEDLIEMRNFIQGLERLL